MQQPEPRRAHYPVVTPGMRPPPPARTAWPPAEARDFRDAPGRQGHFYPQHEPSPTPSPRAWQGTLHGMDHPHPAGPLSVPRPAPRYGSPAHFDPMAPGPRDTAHLSNPMRFQEEAERRPSPRDLGRPLSRGQSLERGWQPPPMRGSGPGPSSAYGPAPQEVPRPIMTSGPARSFMSSTVLQNAKSVYLSHTFAVDLELVTLQLSTWAVLHQPQPMLIASLGWHHADGVYNGVFARAHQQQQFSNKSVACSLQPLHVIYSMHSGDSHSLEGNCILLPLLGELPEFVRLPSFCACLMR